MASAFTVQCPGKVFLFGEYACLDGGPSLLLTLKPFYSLTAKPSPDGKRHLPAFEPASPAGVFLLQHAKDLGGWRLEWGDSGSAAMGTGSSSAQFLLSLAADVRISGRAMPSVESILRLYWDIVGESQGLRPSGADLVAQLLGGPIAVKTRERLEPWSEQMGAEIILAYTGSKIATHEHLKGLAARGFPEKFRAMNDALNAITERALSAWRSRDEFRLGQEMNAHQRELANAKIAPDDFFAKIESLARVPGVLGCKGSGAHGGDCIVLLVRRDSVDGVCARIQNFEYTAIMPEWTEQGLTYRPAKEFSL
ncbi:MAG: hypothetical protein HYW49_07155 [Deltaproteobacteria bacterium]|nr:hypothetical protein [Deltaproteobacteria bacterium]